MSINLNYNVNCQEYNRQAMKKYESVKRIDLMDRQSVSKQPQSRLQSITRSSQRSVSKEHNQYFECYTERIRQDKINQFSVQNSHQNSNSISVSNSFKCNIRTYIRLKPLTKNQIMENDSETLDNGIDISDDNKVIVDKNLSYSFDKVFQPEASQKRVYQASAKQLIKSFINGYNGTIFAYGQTGSGKTYTMFGGQQMNGIIPQAIEDLFAQIQSQKGMVGKNMSLTCSMFEIYKQNICDLMSDRQKQIKMKENGNGSIQIENLTMRQVISQSQLLELIAKGSQLRKTRGTDLNQRSSRSHLIFTLYLTVKVNEFETKYSKLNLVDLAGSQKVSKTKVSGQGLEEAIKINLSLSCLGNTIYALSRGQEHIPFRDSKLTRVLQQSLSGNSITRVIITCSMLPSCKQQTISSLKFANRIKKIKTAGSQNLKKLNEQSVNKFMYQTLKANFQTYEQKLQKIKNLLQFSLSKMTKDEILDTLKGIVNAQSSENQFLSSFYQPLQTFRSPFKQQSNLQENQNYTQVMKKLWSKGEQKTIEVDQHIKSLQQIILKQEKVIQFQGKQISRLKALKEEKKVTKLKILKTNANNIGKIKQIKNKNTQEQQSKQNVGITFRSKYQNSDKKKTEYKQKEENHLSVTCEEIKQIVNLLSNEKRSYEQMERQILLKQVKVLGLQVNQLRSRGIQKGNCESINQNTVFKSSGEQQFLRLQLNHKERYIDQLQKALLNNFSPQLEQINCKKERELTEAKLFKNIREVGLITSPTSSTCLSRINSYKNFHYN